MADVTPRVEVRGVSKRFGRDVHAVRDLSLTVAPGEILAVLGPSGCGKTTLLRLLAGFERADGGEIRLDGRVVDNGTTRVPPEARGVGFVFQDYALFPHLTVQENVAFGLAALPEPARAARVGWALELSELTGLGKRYPHELSGGQQQRTALARALAPGHSLVLLDEPLSNLDADTRRALRDRLRRLLRDAGATALLVTHDRDDAFAVADRIALIRDGRLEQVGTPRELYACPCNVFVATLAGDASILPAAPDGDNVVTALGRLPCARAGLPAGPLAAVLRPHDLSVEADDSSDARVADATFRDGAWVVSVQLAGGPLVRAHSHEPFSPGSRVRVRVTSSWVCGAPAPPAPSSG